MNDTTVVHHEKSAQGLVRKYSFLDQIIIQADAALRSISVSTQTANRPSPADDEPHVDLSPSEQAHIAGLMRINHTGEVCAQALYQGQALTAKTAGTSEAMQHAAEEEVDHLIWCETRLKELNSHPSHLNPIWYSLSLALGAVAGWAGDRWSLGFVAETEQQVCRHLDKHLQQLPSNDRKSKKILHQMRLDEAEHATHAVELGAKALPLGIKVAMKAMAKVMTTTAYRI